MTSFTSLLPPPNTFDSRNINVNTARPNIANGRIRSLRSHCDFAERGAYGGGFEFFRGGYPNCIVACAVLKQPAAADSCQSRNVD